ncbi:class I SAM-dependent methyltransferase [Methanothrix harundinacea]|uniref:O-methyltransferase involved in polyketide biosynthesis n=1 Tax=Methanothrix harundinacea (strain 6Ac) TaxID=1110509 RepID=G7WMV3_METH6|nr:class I SAM-dependent methyltransferase [Methanothrix harundinacea]AET64518.1 O-methyltransferase involved in polyketide biosynthesis [Methanothrix harundinacea 6Ac]
MSRDDRIETPAMLKLHPTASLVTLWSLPLYAGAGAQVRDFLKMLDLSSGEGLLRRCNDICDWYGEVILNRKHFIKRTAKGLIAGREGPVQIVILASGKSPLALELLVEEGSRISGVFEVDLAGMEEKARLYSRLLPPGAGMLRCLEADVAGSDLAERLAEGGFNPDAPAIFVMEGISYYLSEEDLAGIVSGLRSGGRNRLILEYLVPCPEVRWERREIPRRIFSLIREEAGAGRITCYTRGELSALFKELGGRVVSTSSMAEMEQLRLGINGRFLKAEDGWIEGLVAAL